MADKLKLNFGAKENVDLSQIENGELIFYTSDSDNASKLQGLDINGEPTYVNVGGGLVYDGSNLFATSGVSKKMYMHNLELTNTDTEACWVSLISPWDEEYSTMSDLAAELTRVYASKPFVVLFGDAYALPSRAYIQTNKVWVAPPDESNAVSFETIVSDSVVEI